MSIKNLNCKVVKVNNIKLITSFIKKFSDMIYEPFIFINVKDIVIENSDSHTLVNKEIHNIIIFMRDNGMLRNITFLSEKDESSRSHVYSQLVALLGVEGWNLRVTSGVKNFSNAVKNRILNSKELTSTYDCWLIYIDTDPTRCIEINRLFDSLDFVYRTVFYHKPHNWHGYLMSYIMEDEYEIC